MPSIRPVLFATLIAFHLPVLAESSLWKDADITPDTVIHRAGQQSPIQHERAPFVADRFSHAQPYALPPVTTGLSDFTQCKTEGQHGLETPSLNWVPSI